MTRVVGVFLLGAMIYTDLPVCNVAFAVIRNVVMLDENDSVGTFADLYGHANVGQKLLKSNILRLSSMTDYKFLMLLFA